MKPSFLLPFVAIVTLVVGCAADDASSKVESPLTSSSPTEPAMPGTFKVDTTDDPHACPYAGGCDGDVHPSSGSVSVDGRDCALDAKAATLSMDPLGVETQSMTWRLEVDAGACGTLHLEGPHFEKYPTNGSASFDDGDGAASIERGPTSHVPRAIVASATVSGKQVNFRFFFGDEK